MTTQEFDQTGWTFGMKAKYTDGKIYPILSLDFGERLVGLHGIVSNDPEEITMVRCENVSLSHGEDSSTVKTSTENKFEG